MKETHRIPDKVFDDITVELQKQWMGQLKQGIREPEKVAVMDLIDAWLAEFKRDGKAFAKRYGEAGTKAGVMWGEERILSCYAAATEVIGEYIEDTYWPDPDDDEEDRKYKRDSRIFWEPFRKALVYLPVSIRFYLKQKNAE